MQSRHAILSLLCGAIVALASAAPAAALERFTFAVPGAPDPLAERLRAASILSGLVDDDVDDPQELLAAARAEYSRLLGALYDAGHYAGIIRISIDGREAAAIPPLSQPGAIEAIAVTVEPGPPYAFSRATVAPLAPGTELPEGFAPGATARTAAIRGAASSAITGWRQVGHAKARVSGQRIVADHARDAVTAELELAPGPRLRYGDITVQGANRVREARILQMSGLRRADPVFDPDELSKAANRLRRSGAFRSVSVIEAETPNPDGTLDLVLQVAEERRRRYGVGLEYSTVDGFGATAYWMHRNLLGGSERLRIEGEWSSIGGETGGADYTLGARFTRTGTRGPDTDLYIFGEIEQLNEPDFRSNRVEAAIGYNRIASERLTVGVGVGYRLSSVTEAGRTDEFRMLTLPLEATFDTRDDPLNATSGLYADGDLMPFLGFDNTDNGARFFGEARAYRTVQAGRPLTFAARAQLGSILGARINGVPNDMRFYSGGGGTVRGQDYQSLGVQIARGPTTARSGGRSFLGLSGEARLRVTDSIGVVAFADWGAVGLDSLPDTDNSHSGAGLGLRYVTPVGPIRVDVAVPVSGRADGDDYHLYIGIGQSF